MSVSLTGVILAAGKGTRMHSKRPKVMQEILGEPCVSLVFHAMQAVVQEIVVVTGYGAESVENCLRDNPITFVRQEEQLGTGHALQCAWPSIKSTYCLVVSGDTPLIQSLDFLSLIDTVGNNDVDMAFLTMNTSDPAGYGRVVRNTHGQLSAIVEAKDYQVALHGPVTGEVNAGVYLFHCSKLESLLFSIKNSNAQKEYYLPDVVQLALSKGMKVAAIPGEETARLLGVNTPLELITAEELVRERIVSAWQKKGALIRNSQAVRIGPKATLSPGCEIIGPCEIYGHSVIGPETVVESHCVLNNVILNENSRVRSFSHLDDAIIHQDCVVGPFARIRPGTVMQQKSRVGNFVETKKANLGERSKVNHLSYVGDAEIGKDVNIGAGTITCNYDGKNKHVTKIGDESFIGSNTALVAPVSIGRRALIGAGSTITKDVADDTLAVARGQLKQYPRRN